ncbi:MAG: MlaD family protein [Nonlabens sp.]|uniref:MlaD family protein n=1 Tax=Nonlabens sp. TaxID=1888209 RepID=UPI003EF179CC
MKFSKEIKVGILTVVAIALFIFGYTYLKGSNLLEDNRVYYAVYNNVEGLTKSAPVTVNGLRVGNIDDIKFLDGNGRLIVKFHVNGDFEFSSESTASVYSTSLIGGKALAIVPNFESTAPPAKSGDTLSSKLDKGLQGEVMDQFIPLKDKMEHMIVSADSVLVAVNKTLNPETRKAISASLVELNKTLVEFQGLSRNANSLLADNKESLGRTIKNLDTTTENFAKISDTLAQVQIAGTVKQLEETISNFNTVIEKVNNGEGSLGKLMTDDELYTNLTRASEQAADLLQDMKLNPKRYVHFSVFGKRPGKYEEPEDPNR